MSEKKNKISNDSFKNALCYVPFGAIWMIFTESKKSNKLKQNIKYGNIIFGIYVLLNFFVGWFFGSFLFMIYIGIIIFFGIKAYNGEEIEIEYIDDLESKFKDKM